MLFASITSQDAFSLIPDSIKAIELRLDQDPTLIEHLKSPHHQVLLTLRSIAQGGKFEGSREKELAKLLELEPNFLDVEYDVDPSFIRKALASKSKIILSYHDFQQTPDLERVYSKMSCYPAHAYKIAAKCCSSLDTLKMLAFAKKHQNVSVICMGDEGQFGRILGPLVQNEVNYSSLLNPMASQISADELLTTYRFASLNPNTAIYGLIGDPISQSLGHLFHNQIFKEKKLDAVYVKMRVTESELPAFFENIGTFNVRGLSVTMPLKEKVLSFLDYVDEKARLMGAVNTITIENGKLHGSNTDGIAAAGLMGDVRDKHIVLLGAGGAARAIAFEAKMRGAKLTILNRSGERARSLGCSYGTFSEVPSDYDIIINCTPSSMPIDKKFIRPQALAMDLAYNPKETKFLQEAKKLGCTIIFGDQIFEAQANAQSKLWLE